jgi:hypothetical protein
MNALSPTKTIERQTIEPESLPNDPQSSAPPGGAAWVAAGRGVVRARTAAMHSRLPTTAGRTSSGEAPRPPTATTTPTRSGAAAKPRLPPRENQLIAVWLPPLAARATRADSGW